MRLQSSSRLKSFSIIRRIFNSIEMNENIPTYSLSEIEFNCYETSAIDW